MNRRSRLLWIGPPALAAVALTGCGPTAPKQTIQQEAASEVTQAAASAAAAQVKAHNYATAEYLVMTHGTSAPLLVPTAQPNLAVAHASPGASLNPAAIKGLDSASAYHAHLAAGPAAKP